MPSEQYRWARRQQQIIDLFAAFPPAFRLSAQRSLNRELAAILTLWPDWLAPLLPLPAALLEQIALGNLCGWWAATIRDARLDGEATAIERALERSVWQRAWRLLARASGDDRPLLRLVAQMRAAQQRELAARAASGVWQPQQLQMLTARWVCERAAGWHGGQRIQMARWGLTPTDLCWQALTRMLNRLILARQLRDDALDLVDDLRAARASWLMRLIAETIWRDEGQITPLDRSRLAGRWLLDAHLRQRVAQLHATLCAQAAQALARYARILPRLRDLIAAEHQAGQSLFRALDLRTPPLTAPASG